MPADPTKDSFFAQHNVHTGSAWNEYLISQRQIQAENQRRNQQYSASLKNRPPAPSSSYLAADSGILSDLRTGRPNSYKLHGKPMSRLDKVVAIIPAVGVGIFAIYAQWVGLAFSWWQWAAILIGTYICAAVLATVGTLLYVGGKALITLPLPGKIFLGSGIAGLGGYAVYCQLYSISVAWWQWLLVTTAVFSGVGIVTLVFLHTRTILVISLKIFLCCASIGLFVLAARHFLI